MNLRYVSIDIETLGLDTKEHDIIEFGAVLDDGHSPLESLPTFHRYIVSPTGTYRGDAYAMALHADKLKRIAARDPQYFYSMSVRQVGSDFVRWLQSLGQTKSPIIAGKNFDNFDAKFLDRENFFSAVQTHRRRLDVGSMYIRSTDEEPPSLDVCLERAGFSKKVNHCAVDDALDVVRCVRHFLRRGEENQSTFVAKQWQQNYEPPFQVMEALQDEGPRLVPYGTTNSLQTARERRAELEANPALKASMFTIVDAKGQEVPRNAPYQG